MNISKPFKTRLLAFTGGAVVVALAAGGVSYATTPSASTASSSPKTAAVTTAKPGDKYPVLRRDFRKLVRHTVHADLIVKTPTGFKTVDIDRGKLTSVSSTSISLTRPDGPSVTATITSSTKFIGIPESKLAAGDRVLVVQTGGNAVLVGARLPKASAAPTS